MNPIVSLGLLLRAAWLRVRSNPVFVAVSSAFIGAAGNALYQQANSGAIDLSAAGLRKVALTGAAAALLALMHLYRPVPAQPNPAPVTVPEPPKGA